MNKGIFCLSLDMELLWGRHDLDYKTFIPLARKERAVVKKLLEIFDKYNVPVTWAVVGHLFLNSCFEKQKIKHSEMKRPTYSWLTKDWYSQDPCTNGKKNPEWYGNDIIAELKKHKRQEIASHSFSHVYFPEEFCSKEVAESEVKACTYLAEKNNVDLQSFVFPRNGVGHLDVLRKYKFVAYRGAQENIIFKKGMLHTISMIVELFLPTLPSTYIPKVVSGLANIPSSMYYPSSRGKRKFIPFGIRLKKAKRGIDAAVHKKEVFHLWTHPTDLVVNQGDLIKEFEMIIAYAAKMRDGGVLTIETMGQIAKTTLNGQ